MACIYGKTFATICDASLIRSMRDMSQGATGTQALW